MRILQLLVFILYHHYKCFLIPPWIYNVFLWFCLFQLTRLLSDIKNNKLNDNCKIKYKLHLKRTFFNYLHYLSTLLVADHTYRPIILPIYIFILTIIWVLRLFLTMKTACSRRAIKLLLNNFLTFCSALSALFFEYFIYGLFLRKGRFLIVQFHDVPCPSTLYISLVCMC